MTGVSEAATVRVPLRGAGGEAVGFRGTIGSHGLAWLAPNDISPDATSLRTTLGLSGGVARTIVVTAPAADELLVTTIGRRPSLRHQAEIVCAVRAMFALDDDLAALHALLCDDADLAFATTGGLGRMLRSASAFEDVVRTICTTNCSWSATERMISALVEHLGVADRFTSPRAWRGRAFPTPEAMAAAPAAFYGEAMRAGYRGPYFRTLAEAVATGALDLEALRSAKRVELSDLELEARLRQIPGVGPYAAAHIMMLFGRCSRLILDSWTRPRYAELRGRKQISDRAIERHFKRYGDHAGTAFWLFLWKARHLGGDLRV